MDGRDEIGVRISGTIGRTKDESERCEAGEDNGQDGTGHTRIRIRVTG